MILDSARGGFSHVSIICTLERVSEDVCECLEHLRIGVVMVFTLEAAITWVWAWLGGVVSVIIITPLLVGGHGPLVATTMLRRT